MPFYAHVSMRGPIKRGTVPGSIGVLEAPDRFMPIGQASCSRWDDRGFAEFSGAHDDEAAMG